MATQHSARKLKKSTPALLSALLLALGGVAAAPCAIAADEAKPMQPAAATGADGKANGDAAKTEAAKPADGKPAEGAKKKRSANPCAGQ